MDFNPQNTDKSEQIRSSSGDQGCPGQVRSYTYAFCKRGFSNAQALGGRMNIHRRDRAKPKQSSEENLFSLGISIKNTSTDHESQPLEEKILFRLDSGEQIKPTSNHKKICTFPDKDIDLAPQRGKVIIGTEGLPQLPLLVGRATSSSNEISAGSVVVERIKEKKTDLNLDFRLGPESQVAPTLSTREFF